MRDVAGGKAVELVARTVDNKTSLEFPVPMRSYRDCRFSFTGLKATIYDQIAKANTRTELDCGMEDVTTHHTGGVWRCGQQPLHQTRPGDGGRSIQHVCCLPSPHFKLI